MNLALKRTAVSRCPICHFASEEIMPADACQVRYTLGASSIEGTYG